MKKEEIDKKRLMIKSFAIQFNLSKMKSRNRISNNLIEKFKDTNFYKYAENIKENFLPKKGRIIKLLL